MYIQVKRKKNFFSQTKEDPDSLSPWVAETFPKDFGRGKIQPEHSGKLLFLANLLEHIRARRERIVIVSNYTEVCEINFSSYFCKTLEVLSQLCIERNYPFFQLDGQTAVKKRQALVEKFNLPESKECKLLEYVGE